MSNTYSDHFKKINNQKKKATLRRSIRSRISIKAILLSSFGILGCLFALFVDNHQFDFQFPKFEFSIFEKSMAKESDNNKDLMAKPIASEEKSEAQKVNEVPEKHLLTLVERARELDQREEDLLKLETEIEQKNKEIAERISELEKMRSEIASKLKSQVDVDNKKIDQLVDVYSAMRPGQAAKIFEDLDEELAVRVLTRMKKKNAAEILNLMKVEKAKKFTELYTGFYRSPASDKP